MMRALVIVLFFASAITSALSVGTTPVADAFKPVAAVELPVWPDGAPDSNGMEGKTEKTKRGMVSNVSEATLYVFPAPVPDGKAVVACPGGAYRKEALDLEGLDMAQWFNARGVTLAVLKYRLPNQVDSIPLEDLRRALRIMREHKDEWRIDPRRVGVMGASAGGHLAACGAVMPCDSAERADFQILLYPVVTMEELSKGRTRDYLMGENPPHELIRKYTVRNHVTDHTPPAFIVMAADDPKVRPATVMQYVDSLIGHQVPVSFHLYPAGGHGFGFRDIFPYKEQWTAELSRWLNSL